MNSALRERTLRRMIRDGHLTPGATGVLAEYANGVIAKLPSQTTRAGRSPTKARAEPPTKAVTERGSNKGARDTMAEKALARRLEKQLPLPASSFTNAHDVDRELSDGEESLNSSAFSAIGDAADSLAGTPRGARRGWLGGLSSWARGDGSSARGAGGGGEETAKKKHRRQRKRRTKLSEASGGNGGNMQLVTGVSPSPVVTAVAAASPSFMMPLYSRMHAPTQDSQQGVSRGPESGHVETWRMRWEERYLEGGSVGEQARFYATQPTPEFGHPSPPLRPATSPPSIRHAPSDVASVLSELHSTMSAAAAEAHPDRWSLVRERLSDVRTLGALEV
jgi:hypothetical protein